MYTASPLYRSTVFLVALACAAFTHPVAAQSVTMSGTITPLSSCKASTCFAIKPDTMKLMPPKGMKMLVTIPQANASQHGVKPDTVWMPGRVDTLLTKTTDTLRIPPPAVHDTVFVPKTVVVHDTVPPTQTPAPDTTTKPTSDPTSILASSNFEDGTYGKALNGQPAVIPETPGHLAIIADPTNSGHGKVMQVSYACGNGQPACINTSQGITRADLNQFASWNPTSGLGLGSTFYFKGQVYFPANTAHWTDGQLRKLVYYKSSGDNPFMFVVNMFGTDVGLEIGGTAQADVRWSTNYQMPLAQWVTLEIGVTANSKAGAKDGSVTIWINGAQVLQRTGIAFLNTGERWNWLAIGHQREGVDGDSTPVSEVRYWDNITFSTSRQP